jgi:hypothetical protein
MATATPESSGTLDFGRCFTFVTEDPDWITKVILGGLFTLLSGFLIGVPFVLGYWARTAKNVAAGQRQPLPSWDDLGGLFSDGLRLFGVSLVYGLGISLVLGLVMGLVMIPVIALGATDGAEGAAAALGGLGILLVYGLVFVVMLISIAFLPAAMLRAAVRESFGEGFAFGATLGFIQANLGNYALAIVIYLLASFLSQFGFILCCVGLFPAAFWAYMVLAYGLGETARMSPVPA